VGRRRRSRKKVLLKPRKTIPKIFTCPQCGQQTVKVTVLNMPKSSKDEEPKKLVLVKCGFCGLESTFQYNEIFQPVDYYHRLVDKYVAGEI